MNSLVVHEDASARAAQALAARSGGLAMAAVLRASDLALRPDSSPEQVARVRSDAEAVLEAIEPGLPEALTRRPPDGSPSPWDCYREYFLSWSIAPLVANVALLARAITLSGASDLEVIEDPRLVGWWSFRQQIYEAARAAAGRTGVRVHASPGHGLRWARSAATLLGGAWVAGALQNRPPRRRQSDESPTDVLFLSVGSTCAPIVQRVAQRLLDDHGLRSTCVMLEDGETTPPSPGVTRYLHFDHFRALATPWRQSAMVGLHWPAWLLRACRHAIPQAPAELRPALRNRLLVALARDLQATLTDRVAAGLLLDGLRPRAVVGLHLHWSRLAPIVLTAQAHGAATLYLQHGVYLPKDDFSAVLPYDELMVFGEAAAESVRNRMPGRPVVPVGHCVYDDITPTTSSPDAQGPVLVATQPDEADLYDMLAPDWWLRLLAAECHAMGAKLVAKLHPRETQPAPYQRLASEFPATVSIAAPDADLRALLGTARVLVTRDSTVVIEACLLGVPVVTVNLTGRADRFPFARDGGALGISEAGQIGPTISHVLATGAPELASSRAAFLARHAGPCDGGAAARVAEAIGRRVALEL